MFKTKRMILMVLCCLVLMGTRVNTVQAQEKTSALDAIGLSGICGLKATWSLSEGVLTISGSGMMADYSLYNAPWSEYGDEINTIKLGTGITHIGASAFSGCDVKVFVIPNSVVSIGEAAFYACDKLTSVSLPDSVSSVGDEAFLGCDSLAKVVIGKGIEKIGYRVFYDCSGLTTVTLGDNVKEIGDSAFAACSKLKNLKVNNKLQIIGEEAFWACESIETIALPGTVTRIDEGAFMFCDRLKEINLPDTLTSLEDAIFAYCLELENIILHEGIVYIGASAFEGCESLQSVVIPSTVCSIGERAFIFCESLKNVCFIGDAPAIVNDSFHDVSATCYYTKNNSSWDSTNKVDYGGELTWKAYNKTNPPYICEAPVIKVSNVASSGKIKLTWNVVKNAKCYKIYRATSKNGLYTLMKTTDGTSYTNTSAVAGKGYYYKAKAVSLYGYGSESSEAVFRTCDLAKVTGLKVTNVASSGKPKLTWTAVKSADKYEVYRAISKNGTYKKMKTVTGTSYTNISAVAEKTYYYKVKAIYSAKTAANSALSGYISKVCDLKRPVINVKRNSFGKPKVTWAKITGADKYYVYRATSKNGTYKKLVTTTKLSYTNTSAKKGTTCYYKVKAVSTSNSNANSALSLYKSCTAK